MLAAAGLGSRRACEELIAAGRVEVDGETVRRYGARVDPQHQVIRVDGLRIPSRQDLVYLALNKPAGVLTSMSDDRGRRTVGDLLGDREERLYHVGRLDYETEGLMLFTNDGDLAHRLMHPSYGVPKTYLADVPGPVERDLGRRLMTGIVLEDGVASAEAIAPDWRMQLGSLGSGNHFIEVSLDEQDRLWLFLHSGSRGVGNKLANKHIKNALRLCQQWWITLPDPDLAYLVEGTDEFWAYIRDLRWAQHFAMLNRDEMMRRVIDCTGTWAGKPVEPEETVNCHHNYTEQMPGELLAHWRTHEPGRRKGAIDASEGKPGLIPGSMGTASYVVTGKGDKLSLWSSPHGAGRNYSRSAARRTFTRAQLDAAMKGIEWGRSDSFLDEIPGAYKPIDQIMADAAGLVEVRHTLRQIVNVKGD